MYAIIKTGGKQYRVETGSILRVEKLPLESEDTFETNQVLLIKDDQNNLKIGQPFVANAKVSGTIIRNLKHKKVIVFKKKRRKGYKLKKGHRQNYTEIKINQIISE